MLLESGQGAPGGRAGPRPPRPARDSQRDWRPAQPFATSQLLYFYSLFPIIIIFFPRKAGTQDCPSEQCRGRHFPAKALRASAPGAPEREPEGSARPRTLLRADPGFTAAGGTRLPASSSPLPRVPRLTFPSAARPRASVPFLRPAPPRPFHCQPEAAGAQPGTPKRPCRAPSVPAQPIALDRSPSVAGRLLPSSLFAPNSSSPGAQRSLQVQPCPGPAAGPRIPPPPSLFAQDAPSSSPATGILPLL